MKPILSFKTLAKRKLEVQERIGVHSSKKSSDRARYNIGTPSEGYSLNWVANKIDSSQNYRSVQLFSARTYCSGVISDVLHTTNIYLPFVGILIALILIPIDMKFIMNM